MTVVYGKQENSFSIVRPEGYGTGPRRDCFPSVWNRLREAGEILSKGWKIRKCENPSEGGAAGDNWSGPDVICSRSPWTGKGDGDLKRAEMAWNREVCERRLGTGARQKPRPGMSQNMITADPGLR